MVEVIVTWMSDWRLPGSKEIAYVWQDDDWSCRITPPMTRAMRISVLARRTDVELFLEPGLPVGYVLKAGDVFSLMVPAGTMLKMCRYDPPMPAEAPASTVTISDGPASCPRCSGTALSRHDCGPDTYEDDITWTAWSCDGCGLWFSGWTSKWLVGVTSWVEEEGAEEYKP